MDVVPKNTTLAKKTYRRITHAALCLCMLMRRYFNTLSLFSFSDAGSPVWKDCPANQTLSVSTTESAVTAMWSKPTATDNSGVIPTVTCDHDVASQFNIGRSIIQCKAIDTSGNQAVCRFTINVIGKAQDKTYIAG